ncbi:MAG: PASTA domain-containing protein, partial [Actinomycetia bacterium]|nr:PASTA domain-containing protein [Actinomycetes bacterium]
ALAKNPENRYKSANEMKDDLSKLERGIPIKESLPSMDETVILKPIEKPKPKWQRRITFFLLITLSLLFLVVGSYYILQNVLFGGKVAVPPIKGKTFSEAQSILTKVELGIEVDRREFSEDIPKDTIISQDPESGFKLKKGEKVEVVISKGIELVEVPKIIGELEINAGTILGEKGLKIGEVKREFSENVQEDTVLNQTPKAGTKVERGALINIVISKGVQLVLVPDVINKTTSEATSIVSNAGLKYKITEEFSDTADTSHVVRQSPISGTEVKKDTVVEIVISKGEATITMPDVTGKDADDAEAQLTQLGFIVEVKDLETNDPEEFGKVVTQNPIPETSIKRGSVVTIWVGK